MHSVMLSPVNSCCCRFVLKPTFASLAPAQSSTLLTYLNVPAALDELRHKVQSQLSRVFVNVCASTPGGDVSRHGPASEDCKCCGATE